MLGDVGLDGREGVRVEPRGTARAHVARAVGDLDGGIVNDFLHHLEERRRILIRHHAHVERGLHFRRDDVGAVAGLDHRRRNRGADGRGVARLVVEEELVGRVLHLGIGAENGAVAIGCCRVGDARQPLEVGRGRFVEADRRLPLGHRRHGGRELHDGVGAQRHRAVAGRAAGGQGDGAGNLLECLDRRKGDLAGLTVEAAAFGEAELRLDLREMPFRHLTDAKVCRPFLARLEERDHIAVEGHVLSLQGEQGHERGGDVVLVVDRAAAVDIAILAQGTEGGIGPLLLVDVHRVGVRHEQQRTLLARALDPGHQVGPVRVEREGLGGDALFLEHGAKIVDNWLLHPRRRGGRVGGVDLHHRLEMLQRLGIHGGPVDAGRGLRRQRACGGDHEGKQRKSSHARDGNTDDWRGWIRDEVRKPLGN